MRPHPQDVVTGSEARIAELEQRLRSSAAENERLQRELALSRERQKVSAEILRSIAATSGDAEHALQTIAETTQQFLNAASVTLRVAEGDQWVQTVRVGTSAHLTGAQPASQLATRGANLPATVYQENRQIHIPDLDHLDPSMAAWPAKAAREAGIRTISGTPLRRDGKATGALLVYRDRLAPFTDEELALQQTFADQAVIAIENARLFNTTKVALDRQDASAEILRTIASAPTNAEQSLQQIAATTARLFRASSVTLRTVEGDTWGHTIAVGPGSERIASSIRPSDLKIGGKNFPGTIVAENRQIHMPDVFNVEPAYVDFPGLIHARAAGTRVMAGTPLRREGKAIGSLIVHRDRSEPFTPEELALQQSFADQAVIAIENARLFNETKEALERQTATADILRVIASSPADVQPVFDAIAASARRLIGGFSTTVHPVVDDVVHLAAFTPTNPESDAALRATFPVHRSEVPAVALVENGETVQIADSEVTDAQTQRLGRARGWRSVTFTPLMNQGAFIGFIACTRRETGVLADHHVQLLRTFADQAVIAIQNARLFNEIREALERQTATADILKVIASSPSDVRPVFEAIATSANRLLGGYSTAVFRFIEGMACLEAFTATTPEADDILRSSFPHPLTEFEPFELSQGGKPVQVPDTEDLMHPRIREISRARGFRSMLFAPLMNAGVPIGVICVTRTETGTFADHHVQLLQTFADQAVIAIENTRLFNEVQAKTRDLTESLQQQTATADVLKIISRSAFDLQAVFDTLTTSAVDLLGVHSGTICVRDGEVFRYRSAAGAYWTEELWRYLQEHPVTSGRNTAAGRVILSGRIEQIPDILDDPDYAIPMQALTPGHTPRAILSVPLLGKDKVEGAMVLSRQESGPFTQREVDILQTFADQAVIAIENARLFDEVQAKTRELAARNDAFRERIEHQSATIDVLKTMSASPGDAQPVFDLIVEQAEAVCGADAAGLLEFDGAQVHLRSVRGKDRVAVDAYRASFPRPISRDSVVSRAMLEAKIVYLSNAVNDTELSPQARGITGNASLGVPIIRDGVVIGGMGMTTANPNGFSEGQIALLDTFAEQAAIAIASAETFRKLQERTRELSKSLDDLRSAQDRLVQTEKLASLGQLTAGIAHEIKNPLNFVNNFSALSAELVDEMEDVLADAGLEAKKREDLDEIRALLKSNLEKVAQHGKRADSIVKNMLLHSREGSGEHRSADVNALVDESLNLAYHGARAEKPQFNVTLVRDFDPEAGQIEVFPQEITRVLLNLISNGFYAVTKRKVDGGGASFDPELTATTKGGANHVEIRIRDNGTGIPPEVKEKMFNPFFTTKPAGEGTGLGLSMSHDIIVKQHGGAIEVETEPGAFTEFRLVLPRTSVAHYKSGSS